MKLQCPNCESKYSISQERLSQWEGKRLKCKHCGKEFRLKSESASADVSAASSVNSEREHQDSAIVINTRKKAIGTQTPTNRKKAKTAFWPLVLVGSFVLLVIVPGIILLAVRLQRSTESENQGHHLLVRLSEREVTESIVYVDGQQAGFQPRQSNIYEVELSAGIHTVEFRRGGYFYVLQMDTSSFNFDKPIQPLWKEQQSLSNANVAAPDAGSPDAGSPEIVDPFAAWGQDVQLAIDRAKKSGKYPLLYFDASDWCPACERQNQFLRSLLFEKQAAEDFVLVHLDFPKGDLAKKFVENPAQNHLMMNSFRIEGFPTVVAIDYEMRPFATAGPQQDFDEFMATLQGMVEAKKRIDSRISEITTALNEGEHPRELLQGFFHEIGEFYWLYKKQFFEWYLIAKDVDSNNQLGLRLAMFVDYWQLGFWDAYLSDDFGELNHLISLALEEATHVKERGGQTDSSKLLLMASGLFARVGDEARSRQIIDEGIARALVDDQSKRILDRMTVRGRIGTGFLVSHEGYILTNKHVVVDEDHQIAKNVFVYVDEEKLPATLVEVSSSMDLALLRLKDRSAISEIEPLVFSEEDAQLGTKVGALGFPDFPNSFGHSLTEGIVSTEANSHLRGMIKTSAEVEPGNSGGPLFKLSDGKVIGVVTLMTANSTFKNSYGLAIPSPKALQFLSENLPMDSISRAQHVSGNDIAVLQAATFMIVSE